MRVINDEDGELYDSGVTQERCPDCGGKQVWRVGPWKSRFLACSKFPKCKWTSYRKSKATIHQENWRNCPCCFEGKPCPNYPKSAPLVASFPEKQTDA